MGVAFGLQVQSTHNGGEPMPTVTEFAIQMEDRPGTLGKLCKTLADRGVNIIAFQAFPAESEKNSVRLVTDNPTTTKSVLSSEGTPYKETQVAQTTLSHKPGSLGRAATKLGEAKINIDHSYVGVDPRTNMPIVIFGIADVARATKILDEIAAAAA
jgi:hypothetical protein